MSELLPDSIDLANGSGDDPKARLRRIVDMSLGPGLGGVIGNVTGTLAGSHLISSALGGAAGALIGAGLGTVISRAFPASPLTELAYKRLTLDLKRSALGSPLLAEQALANTRSKLIGSGLLSNRLDVPNLQPVTRTAWGGVVLREPVEILRNHGLISVSSACVSTAALAVLEIMRRELGITLRINYKDGFGIEQVRSIASGNTQYDFIVVTDAPFLYNNTGPLKGYQRILVCGMQSQVLLVRPGGRSHSRLTVVPSTLDRRILFLPGSSTEAHLDWHTKNLGKIQRIDVDYADFSVRADQLDEGEGLFAWEPVATILAKKHGLAKDETGMFDVPVSVYADKRFVTTGRNHHKRSLIPASFREVFIATWNYCAQNPKYAFRVIKDLDSFAPIFARAMPEPFG